MKMIILTCSLLFTSALANAYTDFHVRGNCRKAVVAGLKAKGLQLLKIESATFYPGGSDGASSWDDEYLIRARVENAHNVKYKVFVYVDDSKSCRVLDISKVL